MLCAILLALPVAIIVGRLFQRRGRRSVEDHKGSLRLAILAEVAALWPLSRFTSWLILPPLLLLLVDLPAALHLVLTFHIASRWAAQLILPWLSKRGFAWIARATIAHDFVHAAVLVSLILVNQDRAAIPPTDSLASALRVLLVETHIVVILVSTLAESLRLALSGNSKLSLWLTAATSALVFAHLVFQVAACFFLGL